MANLMNLLQKQVSGNLIEQLSQQLGGVEKNTTSSAVESAMAAIMGGLAKNASSPEGAGALASALERDHDGSILDDVMGFLGGQKQAQNSSMLNGAGILKHVLGGNQNSAIDMIAKVSGIDKSKAGQLLITMAPMIMGMLGKVKKKKNLDQNQLSDFLKRSTTQVVKQKPQSRSIFTAILDKDGDGNIMDDLASSGIKALLGGLFKR